MTLHNPSSQMIPRYPNIRSRRNSGFREDQGAPLANLFQIAGQSLRQTVVSYAPDGHKFGTNMRSEKVRASITALSGCQLPFARIHLRWLISILIYGGCTDHANVAAQK
jgi:hypothetical protein